MNSDDIARVTETYAQLIAPLNQSSAMRIKDLCDTYSADKIIQAFEAAGRKGISSWRYIEVILEKDAHHSDPHKFDNQGPMVCRTAEDVARIRELRKKL